MPGQPKHPVNLSTATRCQKSRWSPLRRSDSSGENSLMSYIGKARISALERASCYGVFNSTQINRLKKDPYASERAHSLDRSNCVYSPFEGDYTTIKIVKETSTVIESHMGQ